MKDLWGRNIRLYGTITGRWSSKENAVTSYLFVGGPLDGERHVVDNNLREFLVQRPDKNALYRAMYSGNPYDLLAGIGELEELVYLRHELGATLSYTTVAQRHTVYVFAGRRRLRRSVSIGEIIAYNGERYNIDDITETDSLFLSNDKSVEASRPLRSLNGSRTIRVRQSELQWHWPTETWRVKRSTWVYIEDDIKEQAP